MLLLVGPTFRLDMRARHRRPAVGDPSLDRTVYQFVREHLEHQAASDAPQDQHESDLNLLSSLKKLTVADAIEICQRRDMRLRRVKKVNLSESAERAFAWIREEEREKQNTQDGIEDSDFDGVDADSLMDVKDTNQMNKSVVNLWNIPAVTPKPDELKEEDKEESEKPEKRERPDKEKSKKAKKIKLDRRPTTSITLSDLGGVEKIINQVLEMIAMPLAHPEVYAQIGSDIPRGVLLHGPPGCGKTMLANALANELGVAFINVSAPSVVSGMSGESEKKLREIFDEAKALAPCLIFIDEIDAITPKRESVQREMERRIVAQLLTCMDDVAMEKTGGKPVMIIGATNRPDAIDSALRRGGRFDREICMNVPDQDSRQKILQTISRKLKLQGGESFDFKRLAKMTPGYVGADLHALVAAAGVCAIKRIFNQLGDTVDGTDMDIDMGQPDETAPESLIKRFLSTHPDPLTVEQLAPLAITFEDFMIAVPTVQPSSKREGFATMPDVTWNDVGAMNAIREELEYAIVEPIRNPELYGAAGISAPSGVLLWGPPGCGKTLLAKAVANESQANFISVRGPELLNKYVGESERAVRQVFVRARASVPCVIFFDELDALVPRRDDSNSESSSRVVNTLLTELDGVGDRKGVYVIAATNRPDMIDSAMLRPGRLDKQLFVELPTAEERVEILRTVTRSTPLDPLVDLMVLAHDERCRNFSGADLANLNREAATQALKRVFQERRKAGNLEDGPAVVRVTAEHFEEAFSKVKASVSDTDREKYRRMKERTRS
jgi:ribosome biogenesis ATPase